MKYKIKAKTKNQNFNKSKSNINNEIKNKIQEKKNIKKFRSLKTKKKIKKKDLKYKDNIYDKVDINKEKFKNNEINLEKLTYFPLEFYFSKDLIKENLGLNSIFITFDSINDILTLIYVTKDYSIISYDIVQNKKLNIIKSPQKDICNLKHCLDNKNKRDLILSQSSYNNIKIWNLNNYQCILNLKEMEIDYVSVSQVSFMNHKNNIYIVLSKAPFPSPICKLFDLFGIQLKEINFESNINYITTYNDDDLTKTYIIISFSSMIKSYNYKEGKIYKFYLNIGRNYIYNLLVINKDRIWEPTRVFANYGNYVTIWNFHTGEMLNNVYFEVNINNICLWNNQFLIAITENINTNKDIISLLEINTGILKKNLISFENCKFCMISKINHPNYGEGLLASSRDNEIKLFLTKINNDNSGFDLMSYIADLVYNDIKGKINN